MDTGIVICYPHAMIELQTIPLLSKSQLGSWASFAQSLSFENHLLLQGDSAVRDVTRLPLAETLDQILLPLCIDSLADLWSGLKVRWNEDFAQNIFENLFRLRQRKWLRSHSKLLELYLTAPVEFQNWISERQLSFSELSPLQLFDSLTCHDEFLINYSRLKLTRQQGAMAIEWFSEWYHMQPTDSQSSPWSSIMPQVTAGDQWLEKLRSLRFPNTQAKDKKISSDLLQRAWPQFAHVQQLRRGDISGAELRVFFSSPQDFFTKMTKLNHLADVWVTETKNTVSDSEVGLNAKSY